MCQKGDSMKNSCLRCNGLVVERYAVTYEGTVSEWYCTMCARIYSARTQLTQLTQDEGSRRDPSQHLPSHTMNTRRG